MRFKTILLITLVLFGGQALPANAHDQLIDISPEAGSEVTESSFEVTLTFNNPLLEVGSSAELETQLVGSETWVSHEVIVYRETAMSSLSLIEPGEYLLRWKVVSSDGHPISGESNFILNITSPLPTEESPEPIVIAPNPNSEGSPSDPLTGFYVGLAMVAIGAIFAPIGLMMRRKAKKS